MLIEHIDLRDWGPHAALSMDTNARVVGILGGNGKGKSNILNALAYALTGELGSAKGTDFIRGFGSPNGAVSCSVSVRFRKGGEHGTVSRTVSAKGTSKRTLEWKEAKLTRAADVDAAMLEILGCDKDAVKNAVYIRQGEVDKLVKGTPSERQATFIKLLNLSMADKRADLVKKRVTQLKASLRDYGGDEEAASAEMGELELKLASISKDLSVALVLGGSERAERLRGLLSCMQRQAEAQASMSRAQAAFMERSHDLEAFEATFDKEAAQKASQCLEACVRDVNEANAALVVANEAVVHSEALNAAEAAFSSAAAVLHEHGGAEAALESLRADKARLDEADAISADKARDTEALLKAVGDMRVEDVREPGLAKAASEAADRFVEAVKRHHVACLCVDSGDVCPLCGTNVGRAALEASAGDTAALEAEVNAARSARSAAIGAHEASVKRVAELASTIGMLQGRIAQCDSRLAALGTLPDRNCLANDIAAGEAAVRAFKEAEARQRVAHKAMEDERLWFASREPAPDPSDAAAKLERARAAHAEASAAFTSVSEDVTRYTRLKALADEAARVSSEAYKAATEATEAVNEALRQIVDPPVDAAGVEAEIASCTARAEEIARLEGEHTAVKAAFDRASERLAGIMRAKERDKAVLELIGDLQAAAEITCRTGVPLAFADSVFRAITPLVQEMLERMQSNFSVHPDPDRPLTYLFVPEGQSFSLPQERLSGGQAVRLAVAVLLAAQRTVLPEVGLLVMDEPSSHVDADGVEHMRDMFAKLASILDNADMQLIVVDHNPVLESAFGKTIRL